MKRPNPTNVERVLREQDFIVSKTDRRGIITYGNEIFVEYSGYSETELLGAPHSILRHPHMPACVFKLLWTTIEAGEEIFAFVKNLSKDGGFYWVFAHVTPSYDWNGNLTGYYSVRRRPRREALSFIEDLYAQLLAVEKSHSRKLEGIEAATELLTGILAKQGVTYEEFVLGQQFQT